MNLMSASGSPGARPNLERAWVGLVEQTLRPGPDLLTWSRAFRVEDAGPLDFDAFPFQRELYRAFGDRETPSVDVMKSAQCGVSAAGVSLALYAADRWGANVLYVPPTSDDAYDFSDTRVKPEVEDSVYLGLQVASTDNKGLKRIGRANVYFRGSGSERKGLSIPADVLILDEYDRLDQRNVPKFVRRLNAPRPRSSCSAGSPTRASPRQASTGSTSTPTSAPGSSAARRAATRRRSATTRLTASTMSMRLVRSGCAGAVVASWDGA